MMVLQKNKVSFMLQSSKPLKTSDAKSVCHWGWDRQVLSSVALLHACHPFLLDSFHIKWICASNTVHSEIHTSRFYVYSVRLCLAASKKLSFGEINRCYVQLVVRNHSQHFVTVSHTGLDFEANSRHKPHEWPLSTVFAYQPQHHSGSLFYRAEPFDSCSAVTGTITMRISHTLLNTRGWFIGLAHWKTIESFLNHFCH